MVGGSRDYLGLVVVVVAKRKSAMVDPIPMAQFQVPFSLCALASIALGSLLGSGYWF